MLVVTFIIVRNSYTRSIANHHTITVSNKLRLIKILHVVGNVIGGSTVKVLRMSSSRCYTTLNITRKI